MSKISRRHLIEAAGIACAFAIHPVFAADKDKSEVMISKAKPLITDHVDRMSAILKESFGTELTVEQKKELVNEILDRMISQKNYAFVDP
jgi:hypothetical protein